MTILWKILTKIAWWTLKLRYRIEVKGLEEISKSPLLKKGGILFLPNHPAHMDPLFLSLLLWPKFRMRPVVTEYIYRMPILRPFMKLTQAIPIPNLETSFNQIKMKKAKDSIQKAVDSLKDNYNIILYPAGRLKVGAKEVIAGSSGAHEILQQSPEANVVLIRTTGLWGSSFSRAILGVSPDLVKTIWHGIRTILKNGIFFAPRRKVKIEFSVAPPEFPRNSPRIEFNRYLESWYNRYIDSKGQVHEEEPLQLVSYSFWRQDLPSIVPQDKKRLTSTGIAIPKETQFKITDEIRRILSNPNLAIESRSRLKIDLGMDSLNIAEMIAFLSQKFGVDEVHPDDIETVQDLFEIAEQAKTVKRTAKVAGRFRFPKETGRPGPGMPTGATLQEAFLNACEKFSKHTALGDDIIGVMSYKKLKKSALVLSCYFRKLPDSHIAVMLPASAGAYIVILAILLAKKVPVMLNWTLGPRYLEEMVRISNTKRVVSSWKFLEKLSHVEFGTAGDMLELLEDIRPRLKIVDKLKGVFLSFCPKSFVLKQLEIDPATEEMDAVILFTSGTESAPKAVPLTHKNILANQKAMMQCIDIRASDIIYSILPPFHSFGFSVAGTLPLLAGLKVAFYPDPTDSFSLAEGIERWKITFFCGAPNFMKGLFYAAKPEQLASVRLFVSGAEKAPHELYDFVARLNTGAKLLEGYGITECAPVITLNRLNLPPKGVGHPLPGVDLCTIHLETQELLHEGAEGEICVSGPNVFRGYLGSQKSPFIEMEGKSWYRTGDIGYLDPSGRLILSGRLKRFTKFGGEMISLGAIEEVLNEELIKRGQPKTELPMLAVCSYEKDDQKPEIIVFTTSDLMNREVANEILNNAGFSKLIKVSQVRKIGEIPILGTGKVNHRHLQTLI